MHPRGFAAHRCTRFVIPPNHDFSGRADRWIETQFASDGRSEVARYLDGRRNMPPIDHERFPTRPPLPFWQSHQGLERHIPSEALILGSARVLPNKKPACAGESDCNSTSRSRERAQASARNASFDEHTLRSAYEPCATRSTSARLARRTTHDQRTHERADPAQLTLANRFHNKWRDVYFRQSVTIALAAARVPSPRNLKSVLPPRKTC